MARVRCEVSAEAVGGAAVADGIARASRFAELDAARAVTHNKGFMNGLDAAAVALGQDWRSIEAGAHAYCSLTGPLPAALHLGAHRHGARRPRRAPPRRGHRRRLDRRPRRRAGGLQAPPRVSARELAVVLAAAGLASNLAALRALASEGIQRGHMRLHARKCDAAAPAPATATPTRRPGHAASDLT